MDFANTIQLLVAASGKIDDLWMIFIHVHLAAAVLIFIESDKLAKTPVFWRFLLFAAYSMFAVLNYTSLAGAYAYLDLLHGQLRELMQSPGRLSGFAGGAPVLSAGLRDAWIQSDFSNREQMLLVTHSFAAIAIGAGLFRNTGLSRMFALLSKSRGGMVARGRRGRSPTGSEPPLARSDYLAPGE